MFHNIFIGVGSNIDARENILKALKFLKQIARVTGVSTFYETEPVGGSGDNPKFCNGVFKISSPLLPEYLKVELRVIEEQLGRVRVSNKFAPRTIDLDIVLFEDMNVESIDLTLPDPDIFTREFIALPLLELAPDISIPPDGVNLREVAENNGWLDREGLIKDLPMVSLADYTETLRNLLK